MLVYVGGNFSGGMKNDTRVRSLSQLEPKSLCTVPARSYFCELTHSISVYVRNRKAWVRCVGFGSIPPSDPGRTHRSNSQGPRQHNSLREAVERTRDHFGLPLQSLETSRGACPNNMSVAIAPTWSELHFVHALLNNGVIT